MLIAAYCSAPKRGKIPSLPVLARAARENMKGKGPLFAFVRRLARISDTSRPGNGMRLEFGLATLHSCTAMFRQEVGWPSRNASSH